MIDKITDEQQKRMDEIVDSAYEELTRQVTIEEVRSAVDGLIDGWEPEVYLEPSPRAARDKDRRLGGGGDSPAYCPLFLLAYSKMFEQAQTLGVEFDAEAYNWVRKFTRAIMFCIPRDTTLVVSQKPTQVHWDSARRVLHNESGPSMVWPDGWAVYSIRGLRVDEQLVMRPETQTLDQIRGEKDNDLRSVRIERYGAGRYLQETGARVIDERSNEIEGAHEILLRDDGGRVYLWPTCPSGKVCPPLRVPDEIKTCDEAQLWLHHGRRAIART